MLENIFSSLILHNSLFSEHWQGNVEGECPKGSEIKKPQTLINCEFSHYPSSADAVVVAVLLDVDLMLLSWRQQLWNCNWANVVGSFTVLFFHSQVRVRKKGEQTFSCLFAGVQIVLTLLRLLRAAAVLLSVDEKLEGFGEHQQPETTSSGAADTERKKASADHRRVNVKINFINFFIKKHFHCIASDVENGWKWVENAKWNETSYPKKKKKVFTQYEQLFNFVSSALPCM